MLSIAATRSRRNRAPSAPSMTWWSIVSDRLRRCSTLIVPSAATTGRGVIAPTAKDGCLGQVNDGGEGLDTEGADVGDREGAAAQEVGGDGAVDGTAGQALGLVGERLEAQGLRGADDGDEEAARGVACKAEVDLLELGEYAVLEAGVEHGVLGQGTRDGEADQVVERDLVSGPGPRRRS